MTTNYAFVIYSHLLLIKFYRTSTALIY